MLMLYSRERASKGRNLTLEEIIQFINKIEQNVHDARLSASVSMPKGGNALDTIQSGGQTIDSFNVIDSHTLTGVFTNSFVSHHGARRQQNRFPYKRNHFNGSQNNGYNGYNKARFSSSFRPANVPRYAQRPSVGFIRNRTQINTGRSGQVYRQPSGRSFYPGKQQGQQMNYGPANERRARSPNPKESRSPGKQNFSK